MRGPEAHDFAADGLHGRIDIRDCGETAYAETQRTLCKLRIPTQARRTYDGSPEAELQAEPVETAKSARPVTKLSPSTPSNETLRMLGPRRASDPFR